MATCADVFAQKTSWPELLGTNGKEAVLVIEQENQYVRAEIILVGTSVLEIFKCLRVYVWVDSYGIVAEIPKVG